VGVKILGIERENISQITTGKTFSKKLPPTP